jgi:hypothetical protein
MKGIIQFLKDSWNAMKDGALYTEDFISGDY